MFEFIHKLEKKEDLMRFLKRSVLFIVILILEILYLTLKIDFQGIDLTKIYIYTEAHFLILLFGLIFGIMTYRELLKIRNMETINYKTLAIFIALNLIAFFAFLKLNLFFLNNPNMIMQSPWFYTPIWYLNGIILVGSLLFAFFNPHFIQEFFHKFRKQLSISAVITFLFYLFIIAATRLWPFFARIVARSVYFLLNIFFKGATFSWTADGKIPIVGIPAITAQIYAPCSGLEGMGLFIALFTVLVLAEYRVLNIKRALILLPIGVIGAFIINILRTFLIYVMGHFISADFAIGTFHSNVGWIAFTLYFLVFTYFTYPWMRKD